MALESGTRVGPYVVTGRIGAGGMGEVYRAKDLKLGREVAIKTLPAALAKDKDRLARFEREARLLATLNHPHIAAVYGLDEHEGTLYLAMELVDGATLESRLEAGALPVDEALPLALQIAEALEAAHEKGVVHRDLKPANIMLTSQGRVKVLDFGLAKAFSGDLSEASPGQSPALSLAMTQQGIILGTAGYMAPEQASGQATDQRADIWAFGVVVFEMLTGLPLFSGESVPHILADVLKTEPNWGRLPPNLHPRLKLMLERCLTKRPRSRYHSIADARVDIEKVLGDPQGATFALSPPAAAQRTPQRRLATAAMIAAAAAIAGVGAWGLKPAAPPEPKSVIRVMETLPEGALTQISGDPAISITRDGRRFLYRRAGGAQVYVRELDEFDARPMPGTEGVGSPTFSADGNSILFVSGSDELRRAPVTGGPSVALANGAIPAGFDWTEDGRILFSTGEEIREVPENGGEARTLVSVAANEQAQRPQRLPNGDWILFSIQRGFGGSLEESEVVIESPSSGERRVLQGTATDAIYLPTGHIVYGYEGALYAMSFDVDRLEVTGAAVPVLQGVASGVGGAHQFDIADVGHLIYQPGRAATASAQVRLAVADTDGSAMPLDLPVSNYGHVRASADGRWLAIDTANASEGGIVWIYALDGTTAMRRLTFEGNNRYPVWSPDSESLAFQSDRDGSNAIYRQRRDGTGGAERLTTPAEGESHMPESFSPDGRFLAFSVQREGTSTVSILALEDGSVARYGNIESTEPIGPVFSPDGNWIAYHAAPPGSLATNLTSGVYVAPFPWTGAIYQAPKIARDFQPFWSVDGSELRYVGATVSGQLVSIAVSTDGGFSFGSPGTIPFTLTAGRLSGATRGFDILADGRFVGPITGDAPVSGDAANAFSSSQIGIVLNWTGELERLAPTN